MWARKLLSTEEELSSMHPLFSSVETKDSEANDVSEHCHHDVSAFLIKIQKGIFILGLELGFLVQASTLHIQYITRFEPTRRAKLVLSLSCSYILANVALRIFLFCQKVVQAFLHELASMQSNGSNAQTPPSSNKSLDNPDQASASLEEWKVDVQCNFVKGAVAGVFLSWMCVDMILNFQTQIIYGGIVFLLWLLFVMGQVWITQQQHLEPLLNQQRDLDIEANGLTSSSHHCKTRP